MGGEEGEKQFPLALPGPRPRDGPGGHSPRLALLWWGRSGGRVPPGGDGDMGEALGAVCVAPMGSLGCCVLGSWVGMGNGDRAWGQV